MAINVGSLLKSGAAGGGIGSAFGPLGAGIGAGGGAALDLLSQLFGGANSASGSGILGNEFLSGKPAGVASANRYAPNQIDLMSNLGNMGLQGLSDPYQGFAPIREDALNTFRSNIIPTIMERFNALGDNALSSPSLGIQLSQGAQDFGKSLAAMQSEYGLKNKGLLLEMLGLSLNPQYDNFKTDSQAGLLQQILPSLGTIGTQFLGNKLGGMSARDSLSEALKLLASAN